MIGLTQYLIQYVLLRPAFEAFAVQASLDHLHFFLLVLTTICIGAGGYIINDYFDISIDQINRPQKQIVGQSISSKTTFQAYVAIVVIGFLISIYLGFYVKNPLLITLYPLATGLLFWYSTTLKQRPFWGNLVVALFTAFVPGIIWFAERQSFAEIGLDNPQLGHLLLFYMIFAFLSNLIREIVKDVEDLEGDQAQGCRTLPIFIGVLRTKQLLHLFSLLFCTCLLFWLFLYPSNPLEQAFILLFLLFPMVYFMFLLRGAHIPQQFSRLSQLLKWLMVLGLLYLLISQWL